MEDRNPSNFSNKSKGFLILKGELMQAMTKRDLVDIAFVMGSFVLLLMAFGVFISLISFIIVSFGSDYRSLNPPSSTFSTIFLFIGQAVTILFFSWLLLAKRRFLADRLFPDSDQLEISLPEEAHRFTDYSFWIRLYGLYVFISSSIPLVAKTVASIPAGEVRLKFWYEQGSALFLSAAFSLLVIWKSREIAEYIKKIGQREKEREEPLESDDPGPPSEEHENKADQN